MAKEATQVIADFEIHLKMLVENRIIKSYTIEGSTACCRMWEITMLDDEIIFLNYCSNEQVCRMFVGAKTHNQKFVEALQKTSEIIMSAPISL